MKSYITSIGIANPPFKVAQSQAIEFMSENLDLNKDELRKLTSIYRSSGIENRYSILNDFSVKRGLYSFFSNEKSDKEFPTVQQRMLIYEKYASEMAVNAVKSCISKEVFPEITHLITVSCTGMVAPGIDIEVIEKLGLKSNIQRLAINFMGCYAAFNAMKAGDAICKADPNAKVLIICLEFCTIHFQNKITLDNMVSNAIFGDGAAAVFLESKLRDGFGLSLESFYCDIFSEGKKEMAWHISDFGFEMTLSSYVPSMIKGGIKKLTEQLFSNLDVVLEDIAYYAVHPGGRKILEAIEEALQLSEEDNRYAYEVLKDYGNMSSPTVLFVLNLIFKELQLSRKEENILSFAFGPGLTLESMMLKSCVEEKKPIFQTVGSNEKLVNTF